MPNPLEFIAPPEMSPEELLRLKSWGSVSDIWKETEGSRLKIAKNLGKLALNFGLDMIPGIGDIKSIQEAITGSQPIIEDVPGIESKLTVPERGLVALGALPFIPPMAGILGGVKSAKALEKLATKAEKFDLKQVSGGKWKVLESGKPVAKFDNLEDAYGFIRGGGKKPDIQSAYESIKAEKGYSWVEIADLRDKMGITQPEMEKIIKANPQKYHTSLGDWSLSDEHVRSGAIYIGVKDQYSRPQLLVKVNPLDESKITDLIKKTHKKHYGFSIKEE